MNNEVYYGKGEFIKAFALRQVKAEVYNHFFPVKEEMEK